MKNLKYIAVLLICFLCFSHTVNGESLSLSGESYVLIDATSGRILYENNPHKKMPMASTTKIMTALVAIENGKTDKILSIGKEAVGIEGSSIYLREGETMTLEDILYGLMLRSGNDSSVAIGLHIGDTLEEFIDMMNNKAKQIGANNTNFTNTHGLHDEMHYSTAYDLALITREAFSYKLFEKIVSTKLYTSTREENNFYLNKNKTLWEYDGGDGVKTGYTTNSGRCLVSSAKRNNMRLIAVTLNGPDWFNDNYKLLDYGFENFKPYIIYDKGQYIKSVGLNNGKKSNVSLVAKTELIYPLKEEERENIVMNIQIPDSIDAPVEKGEKIGMISTYLNGKLINRGNLVAKESIEKKNKVTQLLDRLKNRNK